MFSYMAGVATGCLIGVWATIILLLVVGALPDRVPRFTQQISATAVAPALAMVLALAAGCYYFHLGKNASVLLMLLAVLAVAEFTEFTTSLVVSAAAAIVVAFAFLSPGTLRIERPKDRLLLALFLLAATFGVRLIRKSRQWATAQRS